MTMRKNEKRKNNTKKENEEHEDESLQLTMRFRGAIMKMYAGRMARYSVRSEKGDGSNDERQCNKKTKRTD